MQSFPVHMLHPFFPSHPYSASTSPHLTLGLVRNLKLKWDDVNKLYQASPVLSLESLDTIGRSEEGQYEAQLAQVRRTSRSSPRRPSTSPMTEVMT